ncbi:MAG: hypothetical protein R6U98_04940, partial [Pirellulaceae bacterium]
NPVLQGATPMKELRDFLHLLNHAFRNLLPIILVVGIFQFVVIRPIAGDFVRRDRYNWLGKPLGLLHESRSMAQWPWGEPALRGVD